jgi:hypothetical protein
MYFYQLFWGLPTLFTAAALPAVVNSGWYAAGKGQHQLVQQSCVMKRETRLP